jgi:hypothetical protein
MGTIVSSVVNSAGYVSLQMRNSSADAGSTAGFSFISDTVQFDNQIFNAASGGGGRASLFLTNGYLLFGTLSAAQPIYFYIGSAIAATLMGSGNLGVGTYSDGMTAGGSLALTGDLAHRGTKAGFFNVTPVAQQANTVALDTLLVNYGLRASDGYANFATTIQPRVGTTAANTAPLKFTTQASGLTTVEQGAMELIGNSLQFTQLAKRRGVAMTQSVRTTDTTVGNTTTESAALATAEHGANYLEVGKCEEIILTGFIAQRSNVNAFLTIRIKYAGTTVHTLTTTASNTLPANTPFEIRVFTTCRSTGASGTMQINSRFITGGTSSQFESLGSSALVTIDTTTAQNTTVTVQWGEANSADTVTINQARVLCVEPSK